MIGLAEESLVGAQDIERLKSGVVRITATEGNKTKVGTGFVVKLDSEVVYIVTAAHVVSGDPQPRVQFFSRQEGQVRATVKHAEGGDEATGMALLTVQGKENIPSGVAALPLATTTSLSGSEDIIVIGHPRGAGDWAIIKGSIASRQGRYVTIDANIDEGNSGGPIMHNSQVVGLIGGAQRYGKGVTTGTVRDYLEGNGIVVEATATQAPDGIRASLPKEITGKDGAPMVLVPAGVFTMGSREEDKEAHEDERPAHKVYLDAFYIDQYEVTTARFATFLHKTNRRQWSDQVEKQLEQKPVVDMYWDDATAYCSWAGKRLPTEAEWEKAARGTDQRIYPWGSPAGTFRRLFGSGPASYGSGGGSSHYSLLSNIGSFEGGKSPYNVYDMAGNASEWVADWYDENHYSQGDSPQNPKGPVSGKKHVYRGGSSASRSIDSLRSAARYSSSDNTGDLIGFRCARDVPN
ncbi:MAG: hypothetical protein CV081_08005 [Nitrospira sp. LK265]|nr:hypothetical protein [Nitrospira sp. LK265]